MKVKINTNRDHIVENDDFISHKKRIIIDSKTKAKDFLPIIANDLPVVKNSVWAIINCNRVLEYVIIDNDEGIQKETCVNLENTIDKILNDNNIYSIFYSEKDFIYINSKNKKINLYSNCKSLIEKVKNSREQIRDFAFTKA